MALTLRPRMLFVQIMGKFRLHPAMLCGAHVVSGATRTSAVTRVETSQRLMHRLCQIKPANSQVICSQTGLQTQPFLALTSQRQFTSETNHDESQDFLVYQGRVSHMLRALKLFSLTTSAIGLACQPYLMITYQDMSLAAAVPFFAVINMFVFLNPILIHVIAKKYVTQLFFNPVSKVFTANFWTFFARKGTLTFTADDVTVPDVPGMFAMLTVKGRPLFVNESDFTSLEVYKHLMKFDQPIDLTYSGPEKEKDK